MKLKTTIKRSYGFAHIYLRLIKKPLLYGAPSYKSGVQKVNSRGDYCYYHIIKYIKPNQWHPFQNIKYFPETQ